jgi:hypothetical protein
LDLVLIYHSGLGQTYERLRHELLDVGTFIDFNRATAFTDSFANFFDTHHTSHGEFIVKNLDNSKYLVTKDNVDSSMEEYRVGKTELARLGKIFAEYPRWGERKKLLDEGLKSLPAVVP